jgi:glycosyltransferase involved in cell wall biosynthesis
MIGAVIAYTSPSARPAERPVASVAVIVPCFNDGATLAEAVRSVQGQDRLGELVVVDDGSTDPATLEVFARLQAQGVVVVRRPNGGLSAARMTGVQATHAEYVFPLDADDRLLPGSLATLARELDRNPGLDLVWGDYRLFGDRSYQQRTAATLDAWQISYQNDLPASAMIRRTALLDAGGWELRGGYEDWDLWMALAERGRRGARVAIAAYEYRQHGVRMLGASATRHRAICSVLRSRHPALFSERRRAWRRSQAPWLLRLTLPLIFALPIGADRRRLLAGAACHVANGRGVRLLASRAAAHR